MANVVEGVYSGALLEIAIEENRIDEFDAELKLISALVNSDPEFFEFLKTPKISGAEKKEVIDQVFKGRLSVEMVNFLKVLIDKKRTPWLGAIQKEFGHRLDEHRGVLNAYAETAVAMSSAELKVLGEHLTASTGRKVVLNNRIEPDVIGGIRLRIGSQVVDGSISRRLADLKDSLTQITL